LVARLDVRSRAPARRYRKYADNASRIVFLNEPLKQPS
jgi:hypothetical protein